MSVSASVHTAVQGNADELCEEGWAEGGGLKLAKLVPHGTSALMQLKTQAHLLRQRGTCLMLGKHVMEVAELGPIALHQGCVRRHDYNTPR